MFVIFIHTKYYKRERQFPLTVSRHMVRGNRLFACYGLMVT